MQELIGRQFKRNKYGLSDWTETIKSVQLFCMYEKIDGIWVSKPEIMVSKFEPTTEFRYTPWYSINEIVLLSEIGSKTVEHLELKEKLGRKVTFKELKELYGKK